MTEPENIQVENLMSFVGRPAWAIVDLPDGTFGVYQQTARSVFPMIGYPSKRAAASRLLQLLGIGPVAPQTQAESVCIQSIESAPTPPASA